MSRRRHEVISVPLPAKPAELIAVLNLATSSYEEPEVRPGDNRLAIWAFGPLAQPQRAVVAVDDVPDTPAPADLGRAHPLTDAAADAPTPADQLAAEPY